MLCKCGAEIKESMAIKDDPNLCDSCHMEKFGRYGRCGVGVKVWDYDPSHMNPEAEARRCGVET